jgi:hypothetical protein
LTAAWWARSITAATAGSATAHNVDTDFTGENVRSNPATVCVRGRESFRDLPGQLPSINGSRPCSATKNSTGHLSPHPRPVSAAIEASAGHPMAVLSAAMRLATSRRKGSDRVDDLERRPQPRRTF